MLMLRVLAETGGSAGTGRKGERAVRGTSQQRRGKESMGNYYRRTGVSALGPKSKGRTAKVNQVARQGRTR